MVDETGCRERLGKRVAAPTDSQRAALLDTLQRTKRRTAILCPEDNVSTFLAAGLRTRSCDWPGQIGLLSVMGTDVVVDAKISCLRYDFRALGRLAVEAMRSTSPVQHILEPQLHTGTTT